MKRGIHFQFRLIYSYAAQQIMSKRGPISMVWLKILCCVQ